MAPYSSTLAWKIPWMEEPGRLQSMGSLESDTTEWLHFHFSLACIGEGNGNPLQCSCLENPRDGEAWWAAIYGSHRVGHNWRDLAAAAAAVSHVRFFATPWTVAHQTPLYMEFSKQGYWSELPFLTAGDFPDPRIEPSSSVSPALADGFFTTAPLGKPWWLLMSDNKPWELNSTTVCLVEMQLSRSQVLPCHVLCGPVLCGKSILLPIR